ncbi:hypothetical protein VFPPC_15241 [Pochonia chlamydosporia 170]|uniref:Uncharacterized protein n=1 Tax=Pochonia chlamydosporia 170 TaxID=1380566 RepID=A0A179G6K2_METCM|nr:hypothetical protein VFPPC_15241 [Pochonia chlamydosporia 170]OAQ73043.1 hypothetical protein VFPPC_15241 [Pochonia chlamydosporia 170]
MQPVCPLQLPIPPPRPPPPDLHERICPPLHARNHGPQQERVCDVMGIFWKCARIGERLSPYISICCVLMASILMN